MVDIPAVGYALLNTIAGPESKGAYNIIYGGGRFSDYSDHPRKGILIKSGPNKGKTSNAAGKYQFLGSTWDEYKKKLGLKDFSPASQDQAAWQLAQDKYYVKTNRDLTTDLENGDLSRVPGALKGTWTSMPGGIEQGISGNAFAQAYAAAPTGPSNAALSAINAATGAAVPLPRPRPETMGGITSSLMQTNPFGVSKSAMQNSDGFAGIGADLSLAANPTNTNTIPLPRPRPSLPDPSQGLSADMSLGRNPVDVRSFGQGEQFGSDFGLSMAPDVGAYQMPSDFTGGSIIPPLPRPRPLGAPTGAPDPAGLLQQQYARENAGQNPGQLGQAPQPAYPSAFLTAQRQGYAGAPQLGVGSSVEDMYRGIIPQVDNPGGYPMGGGEQTGLTPNFNTNGALQSISQTASGVDDMYKGILPIQGFAPTQQPQQQGFMQQVFSGTVPPISQPQAPQVYSPTTFDPSDPMRDAVSGSTMPRPRPDSAPKSIIPTIFRSGGYLYTPSAGGGYTKIGRDPQSSDISSNSGSGGGGGILSLFQPKKTGGPSNGGSKSGGNGYNQSNSSGGLKPGDRKYNPSTNRWEIK